MKKLLFVLLLSVALSGCTYNITMTNGTNNTAKPNVDVDKNVPVTAHVPVSAMP